MSEPRKKPGVAFWVTMAAVVAIPVYSAAYCCLAKQPLSYGLSGYPPWEITPNYGDFHDQTFWRDLFGPAHWLEKKIRPDKWVLGR